MKFNGFSFTELFQTNTLNSLDQQFLSHLQSTEPSLHEGLSQYRTDPKTFTPIQISELLLACAPVLDEFIANMFGIAQASRLHEPIFEFKKWFVLRRARRRLMKKEPLETFAELETWLTGQLSQRQGLIIDRESAIAHLAKHYLTDKNAYADEIEKLTRWCIRALTTPEGQAAVRDWVSFRLPQQVNHTHLVPTQSVPNDVAGRLEGPIDTRHQREGFKLTDQRMSARQVQGEIDYCIYCHDHDGDFCAKGFPQKKGQPELGFKTDPLGNILTGCPLDEKISEMHTLKRDGYTIAALAMVMIDNPMCPVTGHLICNDCMKSCIYQKQDSVNIPQIETRVLTDVLALSWGVEIYDLLTRWNPLRQHQWVPKPYNGLKVLIAGMGPAGFTLAHHLLMEGFAVVGIDGLKIEQLPEQFVKESIMDYTSLKEELDERIMTGFGGVAEYGITVGGTITVEDVWDLGFDHLAIAVGAGLPQALPIEGSLAPGMRQATDFLMALQLTGAASERSLANLQVRLPAIVIGGGLTGIDTATEVQAYYLVQIEKIQHRYERLTQVFGEARVRTQLDAISLEILCEFLAHAKELQAERERAKLAGTEPDIQGLLRKWGGVTVAYRRTMHDSPAYKRNHEEIIKALEEGIFYAENLEPKVARLDKHGHVQFLVCQRRGTDEEIVLPARAVFVATGAKPNVAYEFEHRGHFQRDGIFQYQPYQDVDGQLQKIQGAEHCKVQNFGPFTSYEQNDHRVTFIGDTHPAFHGSVVKAVSSGMRTYPHIVKRLGEKIPPNPPSSEDYLAFRAKMQDLLQARIERVQRHSPTVVEVQIRAPLAAQKFRPGQFFRLQNFETQARIVGGTRLQTEALAMRCAGVEGDTVSLMVLEVGASSRLCATFRPGDPISLMGPTGVSTKIDDGSKTVMVIGGRLGAADIRAVGPAMRSAGNRVLYIAGFQTADEVYCQDELEAAADVIVWITACGEPVRARRPQDCSASGDFLAAAPAIPLQDVDRVLIIGTHRLVRLINDARHGVLREYLSKSPNFTASIHGPMQCMLKGICAQCLQWQIDPATGQRTKAVFACSWQDQPLDIVDIDNLEARLSQNRLQEQLSNLWLDYLFAHYEVERV
jgi:NADPH-dependent glutamate synthase beta subunit-like oxidoreductase/NAD(P)H-flavin reductase